MDYIIPQTKHSISVCMYIPLWVTFFFVFVFVLIDDEDAADETMTWQT
jgi:hypothetical protein